MGSYSFRYGFAEVSKNLTKNKSKNNYVELK